MDRKVFHLKTFVLYSFRRQRVTGRKQVLSQGHCPNLSTRAASYHQFSHIISYTSVWKILSCSQRAAGCPSAGGPPKCTTCKAAQYAEETKGRRNTFFTDKKSYTLLVTTGSKHYSGRKIFFKLTEWLPSIVPSRAWSKHAASTREALFTYSRIDGARQSGSLTKAQ